MLVKATLTNLPIYFLSVFEMPVKNDKENPKRLLWDIGDKTANHRINWNIISRDKVYGDLRVGQIDKRNEALLAERDPLWVKVIVSKYGIGENKQDSTQQTQRNPYQVCFLLFFPLPCTRLVVGKLIVSVFGRSCNWQYSFFNALVFSISPGIQIHIYFSSIVFSLQYSWNLQFCCILEMSKVLAKLVWISSDLLRYVVLCLKLHGEELYPRWSISPNMCLMCNSSGETASDLLLPCPLYIVYELPCCLGLPILVGCFRKTMSNFWADGALWLSQWSKSFRGRCAFTLSLGLFG